MKYLSRFLSFDLSFDFFEQNTTEKLKKLNNQANLFSTLRSTVPRQSPLDAIALPQSTVP